MSHLFFFQIYCHASPHKIKCPIVVPTSKILVSATSLLLIAEIQITELRATSYGTRSYQISLKSVMWLRKQATRGTTTRVIGSKSALFSK